jgi:hypothetical protein
MRQNRLIADPVEARRTSADRHMALLTAWWWQAEEAVATATGKPEEETAGIL